MNKLKSVFLETHNIRNLHSGFGQFNFHLAQALSADIKFLNDHEVIINCNSDIAKKKLGKKVSFKKYFPITRYPLFRIKEKFNLWHSVNQNTKIEPYSKDMPYLLTVHDVNFIYEEKGKNLDFRINQFKSKIERSCAVAYISEFAKKNTHEHFEIPDIPEYVIYNGNTIDKHSTMTEEIPSPNYVPTKPFIFSIGNVVEKKNFHTLVEMMLFLPDIELVIAGDMKTEYAEKIKDTIKKYRLGLRVFLLGKITESDKIFYYKNCLAFAFPSFREGFGLPVLEAMIFGKPLFLSSKTSLPEVGGPKSFYWENFDAQSMAQVFTEGMTTFENNKELFTSEYISRSQQFTWENAARQYVEVYKSIL